MTAAVSATASEINRAEARTWLQQRSSVPLKDPNQLQLNSTKYLKKNAAGWCR
jgi:hypothetical protein